jgi:hypothetical protein
MASWVVESQTGDAISNNHGRKTSYGLDIDYNRQLDLRIHH